MAENEKPVFPRPLESDEAERENLYRQTKEKLEKAETEYQKGPIVCSNCGTAAPEGNVFCPVCGRSLGDSLQPIMPGAQPEGFFVPVPMYGLSPINIEEGKIVPRPAYGPPPLLVVRRWGWLFVIGLTLVFLVGWIVYLLFFRG